MAKITIQMDKDRPEHELQDKDYILMLFTSDVCVSSPFLYLLFIQKGRSFSDYSIWKCTL